MKLLLRFAGLVFVALSLGSLALAQGEPPDIGTLPGDGTPPDGEIPGLPPGLPPNWWFQIEPDSGSSTPITLMYLPTSGTTGAFATSTDLVNWTLDGVPSLQSGVPVEYALDVADGEVLFVRWVVSEP